MMLTVNKRATVQESLKLRRNLYDNVVRVTADAQHDEALMPYIQPILQFTRVLTSLVGGVN
jgi:hypothetical protein